MTHRAIPITVFPQGRSIYYILYIYIHVVYIVNDPGRLGAQLINGRVVKWTHARAKDCSRSEQLIESLETVLVAVIAETQYGRIFKK